MNWETKRKLVLVTVFSVFISLIMFFIFYDKLFPEPTCTDNIKNGIETGVDCGGNCYLRCSFEIKPVKVVWVRHIQTGVDTYDVSALLSNENIDSAPYLLDYNLSLFDDYGKAVWSKIGQVKVPAMSDFPIVVQNVKIDPPLEKGRKIKNASIEFKEHPSYLIDKKYQTQIVEVLKTDFENGDTPRLYATIHNTTLSPILRFPVRVVLYDPLKNTLGVGETVVQRLDKDETKELVFTWTNKFFEMPTIIRVYPIIDPYSR